jgi:stearoyl-CoA desaturase (delta-9 desaturase)
LLLVQHENGCSYILAEVQRASAQLLLASSKDALAERIASLKEGVMQTITDTVLPTRRLVVRTRQVARIKRAFILVSMIISVAGWILAAREIWIGRTGAADLAIFALMCTVTGLGVELGYHRLITHRSFKSATAIRVVLGVFGSMAAQGPVIAWASIHRMHHRFCDADGDPHSPRLHGETLTGKMMGFWHSHVGWQFNDSLPSSSAFAKDLLRDRAMQVVNRYYVPFILLGLALPAALGFALIGGTEGIYRGLVWGGLLRWFFSTNLSYSVNSFCHTFGSRPYRTKDGSTNLWWLAIPTFGAAWHNDHHAFPMSAFVGFGRGQLDLSGVVVRVLQRLGLAHDVRTPSDAEREELRAG